MRAMMRRLRRRVAPAWNDLWQEALAGLGGQKGLHVGCGLDRFGDMTRLDISPAVSPDVEWDLTRRPYPFEDASFDYIVAFNILEHLPDMLSVFGEFHRILRPGGRIFILCPHFSSTSVHIDPTHLRGLSAKTLDYFLLGTQIEREYGFYVDYRFHMRKRLVFLAGFPSRIPGLTALISARPDVWEDHFCYMLRGRGVYFELMKPEA